MLLIIAILLSTLLYKAQSESDVSPMMGLPPYPKKPNFIPYFFDVHVRNIVNNIVSQSVLNTDSEDEDDFYGNFKSKLRLMLEEFKNNTCLQFDETNKPADKIGINFFVSDNDKNHVELSRSKNSPTILRLTRKVYEDPFKFRYFFAKALGLMPEIQRIDRESELTIFKDSIDESFYKDYEKSTCYYSHFFESDFDFKSAAMPIDNLGFRSPSKHPKHNKIYQSYLEPYYELMLKKGYDFSFSDYRQISYMYCDFSYEENECENGGYPYIYKEDSNPECKCPRGYWKDKCQTIKDFKHQECPTPNKITANPNYQEMTLEARSSNCYINITASKSTGKVQIYARKLECNNPYRCKYNRKIDSIEIKYRDDKGVKGISLFTSQFKPIELPALSNEVTILWIFGGNDFTPKFTFQYREVIPESKWPYWMDKSFDKMIQ
uniref:EGF-like domain-containing protein n=1 Tax=Strongyloides papillosus TaxID=174720 RepID=A0A0N5B4Z5_STREA